MYYLLRQRALLCLQARYAPHQRRVPRVWIASRQGRHCEDELGHYPAARGEEQGRARAADEAGLDAVNSSSWLYLGIACGMLLERLLLWLERQCKRYAEKLEMEIKQDTAAHPARADKS